MRTENKYGGAHRAHEAGNQTAETQSAQRNAERRHEFHELADCHENLL
jgi:hypothetical protein